MSGRYLTLETKTEHLYCCTVHSEDSLIIKKPTNALLYVVFILKFILKHLKSSYMFRSIDHHQGAHVVPC
jgi:hypothetical protein